MRQVFVQVPRGGGSRVIDVARKHHGTNVARLDASGIDGEPTDLILLDVGNRSIEALLGALEDLPDTRITFAPQGVFALQPPPSETPNQVTNVTMLSPIEIYLGGLQSIGSWRGFLGYAAAAGVVVWIGLFTNSAFLLIAAMLIAPFAGPAMNVALATARGDFLLLCRALLRYFAALFTTIVVAGAISLILGQRVVTPQMIDASQISEVALLLPLIAGAAGALNLSQSSRSSMVSGAATGVLVAASLAPPAGLVGMGAVMGEWDIAVSGLFLLFLQLVGINLSGAIVFRLVGLSVRGARYDRGMRRLFPVTLAVTVLLLAGLLFIQFRNPPEFQRSSQSQRATAVLQQVVAEETAARLVEANVRFTRADISGQNTLLSVVYVQRDSDADPDILRAQLTYNIQQAILDAGFNVTPLIDVIVLDPPA